MTPDELDTLSVRGLLELYAKTMDALRGRQVVKTGNNPVGDYAEWLVRTALGLEGQPNSNQGFDAHDLTTGERYEIKARRLGAHSRPTKFSPIRDFAGNHFDHVVAVLFNEDFSVNKAVKLSRVLVAAVAAQNDHVNGLILPVGDGLWTADGAIDLTHALQSIQLADMG